MSYRFKATETFWRNFHALNSRQKDRIWLLYPIFRTNPFDPRLGTHKIHKLSSRTGRTVYSVVVEMDLRIVFFIDDDVVVTFDIGTHEVYR